MYRQQRLSVSIGNVRRSQRESYDVERQDSTEPTIPQHTVEIWESMTGRLSPIKEFSGQLTEESLRWSRFGLAISAILLGLTGILELVCLITLAWFLCS